MIVSVVVAVSDSGVIGKEGRLPWHLPADLRHFKRLTVGHHVIMGRKTHESIGKPLPDRTNIVVTRRTDWRPEGCEVASSLEEALDRARGRGEEEAFVIGGGEIFRLALPIADRVHWTRVHAHAEGDAFFPALDPDRWREVEARSFPADERNPFPYTFLVYERV
jgi:dihydrofolate reductase